MGKYDDLLTVESASKYADLLEPEPGASKYSDLLEPEIVAQPQVQVSTSIPATDSVVVKTAASFLPQSAAQIEAQDIKQISGKPLINLPRIESSPDDNQRVRFEKAAGNVLRGFVTGATTPEGFAGLLIPPVGLAQMAASVPEAWNMVKEAEKTPAGSPERWEAGLQMVALIGGLGAGAKGIQEGLKASPRTLPKEEPATLSRPAQENALQEVYEPQKATTGGIEDASQIRETETIHGNVLEREVPPKSQGEMPPEVSSEGVPEISPATEQRVPVGDISQETDVAPGFVRLYHGAAKASGQAGRDFTPIRDYAQGYADKSGNGQLWFVDVPEGSLKTHSEYGEPMSRVVVPDEIAQKAQLVPEVSQAPTPQGAARQEMGQIYYHGTTADYAPADIATGKRMQGIHLTTDKSAAADYGDVRPYTIDPKAKTLDLSDGYDLWEFMKKREILDKEDAMNPDLERYVINGQVFQYDISSRTHFADQVANEARGMGYDVVKLPDDLGGRGDNIAHVVVNPKILKTVETQPISSSPQAPVESGLQPKAEISEPIGVADAIAEIQRRNAPAELVPIAETPRSVTSIKNEQVDLERAGRGQPPLMQEASRDFGEAWNEFTKRQDSDPTYQDRLIEELKTQSRGIQDHEVAALTHRQVELNNQFEKTANELTIANATGDVARAAELDVRSNQLLNDLNNLNELTKLTGTETARGLNARKMLVDEDFSLSRMILKKQVAKGGQPLTPAEKAFVQKQHDTIQSLLKKLDTRLKSAKTRASNQATELRIRTAIGDYAKPTKRSPIIPDKELDLLRADLDLAKRDFQKGLDKDRWQRMNVFEKGKSITGKVYDSARLILTTGEFSFILRQGKWNTLAHPIRTAKALPDMFRSMRNERTALALENKIQNHPDYRFAKADKLAITDETMPLRRQEEITMGDWGMKIPIVAAFNRGARTFLNKIRFDTYRAMRNSLPPELRTPKTTRQIAMFVNESTGRGGLGRLGEPAAVGLARVFFSPRYLASRFQLAVGHSMWGGTRASRSAIAREYARVLIGYGLYYSLLKSYFDKDDRPAIIELDPRSGNFGKITLGKTTLDPLAGLAQIATFAGRTAAGEKKTMTGKVQPIRGDKIPYGGDDWWDVATNFGRTKLHPVPGTIVNLLSGRDLVGNAADPRSESTKLFAPITYVDVYQALREQDLDDAAALGLLAFLGEGLQTRQPKPLKSNTSVR